MGHGMYSYQAHVAMTQKRASASQAELFTQRQCHDLMNPFGVKLRESRDSESHPHSLAVIFALDVSGSMGEIPAKLATDTLPVFMKALLADEGGPFGGELSGHFYFAGNFNADSGAIALAEVLSLVAEAGRPLSEMIKPIARYAQSGEINFEVEDKDGAIAELKATYAGRGTIDELDGVTVDCFENEGWWCNVRKSNTEPLLRLHLEARDASVMREKVEELSSMLGTAVAH